MHLPFPSPRPALGTATLPDLAAAITRMEGSCTAPGVCRNNNPGNLRAYAAGQPVDSRGIRIFPTYEDGYNALLSQERINISKGLTLSEFFGGKPGVYPGYAPAADRNSPATYAGNVAAWLDIPADVPLSQVFGPSPVISTPVIATAAPADSPAPYVYDVIDEADKDTGGLSTPAKVLIALGIGAAVWAAA